jgi:hypothetical protein
MLDALPLAWLFEQKVPLFFFLIAFMTEPSTWSKRVQAYLKSKLADDG